MGTQTALGGLVMSRLAKTWTSILVIAVLVAGCGGSAAAPTALERESLNLGEPTENLGFLVTVLKNEQESTGERIGTTFKGRLSKARGYTIVQGEVENRGSVAAGVQLEAIVRKNGEVLGEPDVFWPAKTENIDPGSKISFKAYLEQCGGDIGVMGAKKEIKEKYTTPDECEVEVTAIDTQVFKS